MKPKNCLKSLWKSMRIHLLWTSVLELQTADFIIDTTVAQRHQQRPKHKRRLLLWDKRQQMFQAGQTNSQEDSNSRTQNHLEWGKARKGLRQQQNAEKREMELDFTSTGTAERKKGNVRRDKGGQDYKQAEQS